MTTTVSKKPRRQQILESFARMLEASPGARITTAALAKEVGVSEAALYRHFPSKTKMFEGLIEFIESALFERVRLVTSDNQEPAIVKVEKILTLILVFAERNPGITRILTGDALAGETERLHTRVVQVFDRLETQIKQVLREAELKEGLRLSLSVAATVNLLVAAVEGRLAQYVRSSFKHNPTENWRDQVGILLRSCVVEETVGAS